MFSFWQNAESAISDVSAQYAYIIHNTLIPVPCGDTFAGMTGMAPTCLVPTSNVLTNISDIAAHADLKSWAAHCVLTVKIISHYSLPSAAPIWQEDLTGYMKRRQVAAQFACRQERHPHAGEIRVYRWNVETDEIVYQSRHHTAPVGRVHLGIMLNYDGK